MATQDINISALARQHGCSRATIRKHIASGKIRVMPSASDTGTGTLVTTGTGTKVATGTIATGAPLRRRAGTPRNSRNINKVPVPVATPVATDRGLARRIGLVALGIPIVGVAAVVAGLEMAADWSGVQAQIADPHWATILGGIAVAAGFVLPTAFRFLERRDPLQTLFGILFAALCFAAVVMSSSNGMLTAIADGVLAGENRETALSRQLSGHLTRLQVQAESLDCGDRMRTSTRCNRVVKEFAQADQKMEKKLEHIQAQANPQAHAAAQFGITAIQVHTARIVPLILVCLFVWIALTVGMDLVFPPRAKQHTPAPPLST